MKLTVVGCSGSLSGPDSPASSYLLQAPYQDRVFSLLMDCGPGAMGALYRYIDPHEIDAIALSHLHADHCLDLCGYYVAARYSPNAPWPRRPVYAPASAAARLARAYEVTGNDSEVSESGASLAEQFDWHTWQPSQQIGPFLVRAVRVAHPVEAYGIRVEEEAPGGGAMVYSGDTGPSEDLVHFAGRCRPVVGGVGFPRRSRQSSRHASLRCPGRRDRAGGGRRRRGANSHSALA